MLATIGVQPSEVSRIVSLARGSISQNDPSVKNNSGNSDANGAKYSLGKSRVYVRNGEYISQENNSKNSKGIEKYSEEEYNNYGWVRSNDVVSPGYWSDFTSKFASAKTNQQKFCQTPDGEHIIPANDLSVDGVDNVLFYASGSIESPVVTKVVKINLDNETEIDIVRKGIYERQGIVEEDFLDGVFEVYDVRAFPYGGLQRGQSGQSSEADRRNELGRGTSEEIRTDEGEPSVGKVCLSLLDSNYSRGRRDGLVGAVLQKHYDGADRLRHHLRKYIHNLKTEMEDLYDIPQIYRKALPRADVRALRRQRSGALFFA